MCKKTFIRFGLMLALGLIVLAGCRAAQKPIQNQPGQTQVAPPNQTGMPGGQSLSSINTPSTYGDTQRASAISRDVMALGNVKMAPVVVNGNTAIVGVELNDKKAGIGQAAQTGQNFTTRTTTPQVDNSQVPPQASTRTTPISMGITGSREPAVPGTQTSSVGNVGTNVGTTIGTNTGTNVGTTGTTTNADVKTIVSQRVRAFDPGITRVYVTTDTGMVNRLQRLVNSISSELNDMTSRIQAGGGLR